MIVQPAKLRYGKGSGKPEDGLCLLQMVDWFSGQENVTDHPECACPVLSTVGIRLNDTAPSQAARDSLWPLVWRLLDSKADAKTEQLRAEYFLREVTHRIVAPAFDDTWPKHAAALRCAQSISEIRGAAGRAAAVWMDPMSGVTAAMAWAVEAAAKAVAAAAKASAVAGAVAAVVGALEAAAAAAEARTAWAAEAVAAEARREEWWKTLRDIFIEAIELGPHGEEDPVYIPRAEALRRILVDVQ